MLNHRVFILLSFILLSCFSQAGNPVNLSVDSLIQRAKLVYQYDPTLAYNYSKQAIKIAQLENSELKLGRAYEMFGISFDYLGELDSALLYFDRSIELLKNKKEQIFLARTYTSKANSLFLLNKNKEALGYYVKAYDIFKAVKSSKEEASALMGIGNVYSSMKFYDLALKYYDQSLAYFEEVKDSVFISYMLTNIAEVYAALNKFDQELEYQRRSLSIKEKLNDDYGLVYSYTNMAGLMCKENKKDSALYFAYKAIEKSKKINNLEFLSSSFQALGNVYFHFNQYPEAIEYFNQALQIARRLKNTKTESSILKLLADVQIKSGDYKNASNSLLQFIAVNDSANSLEMQKSFNELQTQYETDKKEKEILLLNERDKKRQLIIYSIGVVVILLGLLSFVLYNRFRLKRKTASELELRNAEIQRQKHLVDEKQKEILDSINYAKRIQFALLAHDELLNNNLPEHFVVFKPKDIVSGDFYWATRKDDFFYLAVCDSTGHGVPGAFMSLLNISFLNEAINEKNITAPHNVLNHVRTRLTEHMEDGQDGMDAILMRFPINADNSNTIKIDYAAANNAPVLIRNNAIIELPKDKMPVGRAEKMELFTLHTLELEDGDHLYLYTDGFADQFGGQSGKKFKRKKLNDYLVSMKNQPMDDQGPMLVEKFEVWRSNLEQVDDVCIIGIRI